MDASMSHWDLAWLELKLTTLETEGHMLMPWLFFFVSELECKV